MGLSDCREPFETKRAYQFGRRAQDILFSALALLALAPFMLLLALIIVIDSPGAGPIFVQERIGKNGKSFRFFKFGPWYRRRRKSWGELLKDNEMDGPVFKIKEDPRITRIGKFIRKTGIDELPQLLNILKGNMSLVGPRPALPREVEQYDEFDRRRLSVKPGLTCYWQIQPHRNSLSFEEWMELDQKYIRERSFWVDWKIIFGTVKAVVTMQGNEAGAVSNGRIFPRAIGQP
ncbi:MAG: sugar transferase [Clostridia bacterium]